MYPKRRFEVNADAFAEVFLAIIVGQFYQFGNTIAARIFRKGWVLRAR
jgi:hypothetical protein